MWNETHSSSVLSTRFCKRDLSNRERFGICFFLPSPLDPGSPSFSASTAFTFTSESSLNQTYSLLMKEGQLCRVNEGFASQTCIKVFCIPPDWTILHVVRLRALEAELEVLSDYFEIGIFSVSLRDLISSRTTGVWICWQ